MTRAIIVTLLGFIYLSSCRPDGKYSGEKAIKYDQYMFQGELLYQSKCLNCHQKDGSGLGKLIPPLKSDFISKQQELAICIIKNGMKGPIEVNGVIYDGVMPGNARLTPLEIAEIMTYIGNSWGNDIGMISPKQITTSLQKCQD